MATNTESTGTGAYVIASWIVWLVTFAGCWLYAIGAYGFFLGVGLGWIPSAIIATLAALFWPLALIGIVLIVLIFAH